MGGRHRGDGRRRAYTINMPAFLAFVLLVAVYVILGIAGLGGMASWVTTMTKIGGWVALADMVAAWYLGFAIWHRTTWPAPGSGAGSKCGAARTPVAGPQ